MSTILGISLGQPPWAALQSCLPEWPGIAETDQEGGSSGVTQPEPAAQTGWISFGKARSDYFICRKVWGDTTVPGTPHRLSHGSQQPLGPGSKSMRRAWRAPALHRCCAASLVPFPSVPKAAKPVQAGTRRHPPSLTKG